MASSFDGSKIIKSKTFFDLKNYKSMSFDLGKKLKKKFNGKSFVNKTNFDSKQTENSL